MANTSILNQSYWAAAAFVPDLPPLRISKSESILDRLARLMTMTMGVSTRLTSQSLVEGRRDSKSKGALLRRQLCFGLDPMIGMERLHVVPPGCRTDNGH